MSTYQTHAFPLSRIATIDVCETGRKKHHVAAMIELDITESRKKVRQSRTVHEKISFTAWLVKAISLTIEKHQMAAAFLKGKRSAMIFDDINISMVVEKEVNGQKVPIPMIIEKTQKTTAASITRQINNAKTSPLTEQDKVLQKNTGRMERIYYHLPGFLRRGIWKFMLKRPRLVYGKMGNVAITSIGMMGNVKGWFIPFSIHPLCFGISTIQKKPVVVNDQIVIREMLSMTILLDHDVIDGSNMARFINDLSKNIENGTGL